MCSYEKMEDDLLRSFADASKRVCPQVPRGRKATTIYIHRKDRPRITLSALSSHSCTWFAYINRHVGATSWAESVQPISRSPIDPPMQ
jgi:hypothetical protein